MEEWDGTWKCFRNSEKPEQQQKDGSSTDVPLVFFEVDYFIQGIDRCISGHNLTDLSVLNNP